ncbi:MAG: DUF4411 family protein [Bacteroidota bacterium]|nr:DUF4411 family protein [Bacteroidota bacterium]
MLDSEQKYCLDTNFFIEAWNKYYSPDFCSEYWEIIDELAKQGIVFITREVKKEIDKGDDNLRNWLKDKSYIVKPIDESVQLNLKKLYAKDKSHQYLANNIKNRSIADPWVIAHAMAENAIVVTKEYLSTSSNPQKVKIPDVCENMNVKWINDFDFIKEVNIKFNCKIN